MQISSPGHDVLRNEMDMIAALPLDGARILELGCGAAERTRAIAKLGRAADILALEVDARQHAKNLAATDLPGVRFALGGAEAIPAADASIDIVFLFKSLHHVPVDQLDTAFAEIHRVLVPGGLAHICEPVFAGDYNEILRLFHDEQSVRAAAFDATVRAVDGGLLSLVSQTFFLAPVRFRDFASFEDRVLKVTHTEHRLSPALYDRVREKFHAHLGAEGAQFATPMRVDLLRKPH